MDSLPGSVVEADDVATAARFVLLCKRGDASAAADFLRRTLAEVDGSALDLTTLTSTLGYDFIGADMRNLVDGGSQSLPTINFVGDEVDKQHATLILLIPGDMHIVGHLIGKGGLEIGKIENESGASIKIEAQSQIHSNVTIGGSGSNNIMQLNERVVTITGTVTSCVRAQRLLDRRLRARLESDGIHREVLRVIVPNDFVRHLIGKNGCNITQLQAQTGIRIQVQAEANMAPHQLGRVVTFQGAEHGRAIAQYYVSRQIADGPFRDWPAQPQPTSPTVSATWPSSPQPEWISMDPPKTFGSTNTVEKPSAFASHLLPQQHSLQINHFGEGETMLDSFRAHHAEPSHFAEDDFNDPSYAIQLTVPNPAVAFLIGKGGSTVTEMEAKSGARIRIAKQTGSELGRVVSIKGTPGAVRAAQALVQSRLDAYLQVQGGILRQ